MDNEYIYIYYVWEVLRVFMSWFFLVGGSPSLPKAGETDMEKEAPCRVFLIYILVYIDVVFCSG